MENNYYYVIVGMVMMLGLMGIMEAVGLVRMIFDDPYSHLIGSSLFFAWGMAMYEYDEEIKKYLGVKNET